MQALADLTPTENKDMVAPCEATYQRIHEYIRIGALMSFLSQKAAPGERALDNYFEQYQQVVNCVKANQYPEKALVNKIEKLAVLLEVLDGRPR